MSIFSGHGVWCTLPGEAELGEAELFSRLLLLTTSFTTGSYGQFMGAAVAETLGMVVFIPGELVRMRMMNNPGRYSSFIQASFTQTAIFWSLHRLLMLMPGGVAGSQTPRQLLDLLLALLLALLLLTTSFTTGCAAILRAPASDLGQV